MEVFSLVKIHKGDNPNEPTKGYLHHSSLSFTSRARAEKECRLYNEMDGVDNLPYEWSLRKLCVLTQDV